MIRFLPDFNSETNELLRQEQMQLANGFTNMNIDTACEKHPDYENLVLIGTGATIGFKIVDTCCSDFRQRLVLEFGEALYGEAD